MVTFDPRFDRQSINHANHYVFEKHYGSKRGWSKMSKGETIRRLLRVDVRSEMAAMAHMEPLVSVICFRNSFLFQDENICTYFLLKI